MLGTLIGTTSVEHDDAGNLTKDDLRRYLYNGEGRLVKLRNLADTADVAEYLLDGAGLRVKKCVPNCSSPTSRTVYVFSGSKVIAEYDDGAAVGSPSREYIFAGSQMVASIEGSTTRYHHSDHLSTRVTTNTSGTKIGQQGHLPFGESWYTEDVTAKQRFTSYERDSESGNDYAMFRSHMSRLARFSAPDPVAGSILDPQSLNRYAYVRNDPINMVDPLGLDGHPCVRNGIAMICVDVYPPVGGGPGMGSGSINEMFGGSDLFELVQDPPEIGGGLPPGIPTELPPFLLPPRRVPPVPPPLGACDPRMIAAFNEIWRRTTRFPERVGESAFVLTFENGDYRFAYHDGPIVNPQRGEVPHVNLPPPTRNTAAVGHTHAGRGTPSEADRRWSVPNFVVSLFEVRVTNPRDPTDEDGRQVRGRDWQQPCPPQ